MAYDPLARFRREPKQPEQTEPEQSQAQVPDEHRALRVAIDALVQVPNTPLFGDYKNTYSLIPVLETAYQNAERELEQQRAITPMTDAEMDAAVEHDINLFEEVRQDWKEEPGSGQKPESPAMTEEELQKGVRGWERLAKDVAEDKQKQREQEREPDIEPGM